MSSAMLARLKGKESEYFVTFSEAGVKDIILPGKIRNIMNKSVTTWGAYLTPVAQTS
jgi:hypothetical protein